MFKIFKNLEHTKITFNFKTIIRRIQLTVKMKNNSINIAPNGKIPDMMILKKRDMLYLVVV